MHKVIFTICQITFIILVLFFSIDVIADSSNLEEQRKALDIIADFADRLCKTVELEGRTNSLELSGKAKAELNSLIRKIVDLGIEGAAKYETSEWEGLLQKDLAGILKDNINCRIEVWKDLKDKLITSYLEPPKVEHLIISDNFETTQNWAENLNHPYAKTYYDQGGFIVENVSQKSTAMFGFYKIGAVGSNAKIGISVKKLSNTPADQTYGLMFGSSDAKFENCYTLSVREDGIYMVIKWIDNKVNYIQWKHNPVIRIGRGAWNRLQVGIKGRRFDYYINDKQLGYYVAEKEVMGFIGIFSDNPGLKVVYDDLQVVEYKAAAKYSN